MSQHSSRLRRTLIIMLVVLAARLPLGMAADWLLRGRADDPAARYAALILQETLLWGLPSLLMRPWQVDGLKPRGQAVGLSIAALVMGAVAQMAMMGPTGWWADFIGAPRSALPMPQNEVQWVLAVLALVVTPAVMEEAFFRGGVQTALQQSLATAPAVAATTLIFALMHGSLAGVPSHLVISLMCSLGMACRGRLRVSIAMHMAYNGAALLLRDVSAAWMPVLPLAVILAACALYMISDAIWLRRGEPLRPADAVMMIFIAAGTIALYIPQFL